MQLAQQLGSWGPQQRKVHRGASGHRLRGYGAQFSLVAQSCPTLCDPIDCSTPGSSVHGIFQARIMEWVAIPFSRDFPDPGVESRSPALKADSLLSEPPGKPWFYFGILQTSSLGASLVAREVKELLDNVGDSSLIPGLGRPCGGGNGISFQYSCLEIFMDRGAWWATSMGSQRVRRN